MFTLRVTRRPDGYLVPDARHPDGGEDYKQYTAFRHLTGANQIPNFEEECLQFMCDAHAWSMVITLEGSKPYWAAEQHA